MPTDVRALSPVASPERVELIDILVSYALVGFLLLPFRRRKLKTLAIWTVVLLLIPLMFFAIPVFLVEVPEQDEQDIRVAIESANEAYSSGDYGLIFGQRAIDVLTVALYLTQIPLSRWWLKRYRFGPAEWLWRSLTYRQLQVMR